MKISSGAVSGQVLLNIYLQQNKSNTNELAFVLSNAALLMHSTAVQVKQYEVTLISVFKAMLFYKIFLNLLNIFYDFSKAIVLTMFSYYYQDHTGSRAGNDDDIDLCE